MTLSENRYPIPHHERDRLFGIMLAPRRDIVWSGGQGQGGRRRMVSDTKDWVFEVGCTGAAEHGSAARDWAGEWARNLEGLAGMTALDLYTPSADNAHDPFNKDAGAPLFIAMLAFRTREALGAALDSVPFAADFAAGPAGVAFAGSAFERHFYPVDGRADPLAAPFSYVVRYHKPAEDEAAFIRNYVATHPPTLATLPGIRAVMCYFPLSLAAQGVAPANYIIGNEVAFDSVADFNLAMQSPVRQELRRHFHEFPPFSGINTHVPMNRSRMV